MKHSLKLIILSIIAVVPFAAHAQSAKIHFENLNGLETKARDVVEVTIDGKVLDLAKRVLAKSNDADARKVSQAISGLQAIYVRAYTFANENEYNPSDVEEIRAQLRSPGWEKLANVRSKKNDQKVDVYTMFNGDLMSGVAVIVSRHKNHRVINVIGPIDIELLTELSGKMSIPKMDVEIEKSSKAKN
jgi:hypothetical protein